MGQIAFAIGGAVAGTIGGIFLGNPLLGAAIGFSVGTALGNAVYGTRKADMGLDGSRMGDNTVQSSAYGATLPKVYGRWRLAGNMIWSTGIYDKAVGPVSNQSGSTINEGKGGSINPNDPQYVASFALALCEGPIVNISKIFADGRLIYNAMGSTVKGLSQFTDRMTVYLGTDTQEADPTMIAAIGGLDVPAYLDVCYVVMTEFPCSEFGNRIPNFTFEILSTDAAQYPVVNGSTVNNPTDELYLSTTAQEIYTLDASSGIMKAVRRSDNTTRISRNIKQAVADKIGQDVAFITVVSSIFLNPSNDNYLWVSFRFNTDGFIARINPQTLQPDKTNFANRVTGAEEYEGIIIWDKIITADKTGAKLRFYHIGSGGHIVRDMTITGPSATARPGTFATTYGKHFLLSYEPGSNPGDDDKFYVTRFNISGEAWHNTYTGYGRCKACFGQNVSASQPRLFVGINNQPHFWSINLAQIGQAGPVTATPVEIADIFIDDNQKSAFRMQTVQPWIYHYVREGTNIKKIQLGGADPGVVETIAISNWASVGNNITGVVFEINGESIWCKDPSDNALKCLLLHRRGYTTLTLDAVVGDILQKAGLTVDDYDVSQLASKTVYGYCITRQMPAKEAIRPLAMAYQFEACESEGKIKFVPRGGAPVFPYNGFITGGDVDSVLENDLGVTSGEETIEKLALSRAVDNDLPWRVNISYINPSRDYNEASQSSQRYKTVINTSRQVSIELPIAWTDALARDLADKLLYQAPTERETAVIRTFWRYILLDPCDVITYQVDGKRYTHRVVSLQDGGAGVLEFALTNEDSTVYSVTTTAQSTDVATPPIDYTSPTMLFPLDIPILRNVDDEAGYYLGASPLTDAGSWAGCTVMRSLDGTSFTSQITLHNQTVVGTLESLPKTSYYGNRFDPFDSCKVRLANGAALSSDTEINVLNGANMLCIGNGDSAELLQFQTATLYAAPDVYAISNLLRGRKGTERSVASHEVGDSVVLVTETTLRRIKPLAQEINAPRVLRAQTFGESIVGALLTTFTNTGVGLKPYAGVQPTYEMDGNDFVVSWKRRSRVSHEWVDYVDTPVGEDTESYEVEFSDDGVDYPFMKTFTSAEATLTDAEQTSEFGGTVANLWVRIYQMSAVVGRGYVLEAGPFLNTSL